MNPVLNWRSFEDIAVSLCETHPGQDPLKVRFTDLRDWVKNLPGFEDASAPNEGILEAIQMAWLDEFRDS